jgi:hypothetical protein
MKSLRLPLVLLLLCITALPAAAAAPGPDVTVPVAGLLFLDNDVWYRTEFAVTNHRDVAQNVLVDIIDGGTDPVDRSFTVDPRTTLHIRGGLMQIPNINTRIQAIGAFRFTSAKPFTGDVRSVPDFDPLGQLEVRTVIVQERGRFGSRGSTRQEVEAVPASEYQASEQAFVGVQHDDPTYTNVGIVNLDPTSEQTFFVEFEHHEPFAVTVPPATLRQVRIPGKGRGDGTWVRVYPDWAVDHIIPVDPVKWVAYASTVNGKTGDAYSGMRVPTGTSIDR